MTEVLTCNICVEKINKSTRKEITCGFCDHKACASCYQSYLLTVNVPQCMNCHHEFLRKFLNDNFTKTFIDKTLKDHHKKYLFDIETSLLPAAVIEAKKRKDIENIKNEIKELELQVKELNNKIFDKRMMINNLRYENNRDEDNGEENARINFIRRCPAENCKGYLSNRWKCELCSVIVCKDCHKIKNNNNNNEDEGGNEHVCNNDDVETARMITANTKACPSCTVPIFKIDGCDQMWCVSCHTAFSWATGKIQTAVHNPHYFEWLRRNGNENIERNPLDIRCGRDLDHLFVRHFYDRIIKIMSVGSILPNQRYINYSADFALNNKNFKHLDPILKTFNIIRRVNHILYQQLPNYVTANAETYNLELRIRYINNEIDEKQFKTTLFSAEKRREKNREIHNILTMYCHSVIDIIHRVYDNLIQNSKNQNIPIDFNTPNEINELILYVNANLLDIAKLYNNKNILHIDNDGDLSIMKP